MPFPRALLLSSALLALAAAGCRDREITAYNAPKETTPALPPATGATAPAASPAQPSPAGPQSASAPFIPMAAPGTAAAPTMANTAVPTASGSDLKWTAPTHWQSAPAAPMRKATYTIAGDAGAKADLSISVLSADGGGELANLNRWRTQFLLPAVTAADLATALTRFEANGLKFAVADLTNDKTSPPQRLLGAMVPVGGDTWFFKLTGPAPLLAREQPAFLDFLKSLKAP